MHNAIPLSSIDCSFTGEHGFSVQFAFFYDDRQDAEHLRRSLTEVLESFAPVHSALICENYRAWLQPLSPDDVDFTVVEHSGCAPESNSLPNTLANLDLPLGGGSTNPLARFCLNQFHDGAVLVVNISHVVVDGFSYFYFLGAWGLQARGNRYPQPSHDRNALIPQSSDLNPSIEEVQEKSGLCFGGERVFAAISDIVWSEVYFDESEFFQKNGRDLRGFSGNTLLCAYLWRQLGEQWHAGAAGSTRLFLNCAVDLRSMLHETLSKTYFGNAIHCVLVPATLDDVRNAPLRTLCEIIRSRIFKLNVHGIRESIRYITAYRDNHGIAALRKLHLSHPDTGLLVTNLARLPLRDLDFGRGPPTATLPIVSSSRIAIVLPGAHRQRVIVSGPQN